MALHFPVWRIVIDNFTLSEMNLGHWQQGLQLGLFSFGNSQVALRPPGPSMFDKERGKKKKSLLFPFQSQIIEETKGKTKRNLMATFIDLKQWLHLSRARQSGTPCFLLLVPPSLWAPPASCLALEGTGANSQRFHYGIRLLLLLWKKLCWLGFILKAALLFAEYPERLKFGDGSLMDGTNVCVVSNYCCSIWMAFLFCPHWKNHMEGWFWSHTRLSLNETMRMIAGILIFFH